MGLLVMLISWAISAYIFIIILQVAISWLVVFGVMNLNNPQARNLMNLLARLTEPVMKRVRQYVPPIGGIDLTPIVVIIGLQILNWAIAQLLLAAVPM